MTDVQTKADTHLCDEASAAQPGAFSTRRCVLLGAAGVGATAVLAACGTSNSNTNGTDFSNNPAPAGSGKADANGGSTGGTDSGDSGGSTGGAALASVADVPEGGGIIAGDLVITQPTAGQFKAFSKVCTHQGCDVNKVEAGVISCPCHGSKFAIDTGAPTAGPAKKGLPETKVKVDGQNIVKA
jgi:Rieske Fe-S protein